MSSVRALSLLRALSRERASTSANDRLFGRRRALSSAALDSVVLKGASGVTGSLMVRRLVSRGLALVLAGTRLSALEQLGRVDRSSRRNQDPPPSFTVIANGVIISDIEATRSRSVSARRYANRTCGSDLLRSEKPAFIILQK